MRARACVFRAHREPRERPEMESESPLEVLSRAATMLHREEAAAEPPYACTAANRARALSLRCSAMEGTVGTVGKWKRERRHRAVSGTSPVSPQPQPHFRNSQEHALDMRTTTTTAAATGGGLRATPHVLAASKERASVIIASSPAAGHRASASAAGGTSDPVIDEHFRRSLGKDYMNVFAPPAAVQQQQQRQRAADRQQLRTTAATGPAADAGLSAVDDHFAKALGDTWVKLQKEEYQKKRKETTATESGSRQQKVNVYVA